MYLHVREHATNVVVCSLIAFLYSIFQCLGLHVSASFKEKIHHFSVTKVASFVQWCSLKKAEYTQSCDRSLG